MHYPDIDRYATLTSPIHHLEPRVKILSFTILIFSVVFVQTIQAALLGLTVAAILLLISRLPFRFIIRRSKVILIFILPILLLMPLTVPGTAIWSAGPVNFTQEGLSLALLITSGPSLPSFSFSPCLGHRRLRRPSRHSHSSRYPASSFRCSSSRIATSML